jgi:hypothetical protein
MPGPVAFAPEAHLPAERRLVVDASGLTLETMMGLRNQISWSHCSAVLVWSDRVEIVLDSEISVVVRASDWHQGVEAVRAIKDRVPSALLVPMLDDPEPEPARYVLRGLQSCSSAILVTLLMSALLCTVIGLSIGIEEGRTFATVFGLVSGLGCAATIRALKVRLRVPRQWRDAAAVRGRTSVAIDSGVARASDKTLEVAEFGLYLAAGIALGWMAAAQHPSLLPPILILGVALAVRRERKRRLLRDNSPR